MKSLFFILALTALTGGKPLDSSQEVQNYARAEQQTANKDFPQKGPKQDEDGDDGDDGGGALGGLGNLLGGGGAAASQPQTVTGLLLNGLTGGLFASFIPGETGQAVNNLYNQFTGPLNKVLEGTLNLGIKQLLATTLAPVKATAAAPTTPNNNVVVQEVSIQQLQSNQIPGGANIAAQLGSQGQGGNFAGSQFANQQGNRIGSQGSSQNSGGQSLSLLNAGILSTGNQVTQQTQNQNTQQFVPPANINVYPVGNPQANINVYPVGNPQANNEIRVKGPLITNLADLKYLNTNYVSPIPITAAPQINPSNQSQTTQKVTVETTTEDEDDDGEDEDSNRA